MPSSMFLPAAAPEKDGNSGTEELGKQSGECRSMRSTVPATPPTPSPGQGAVSFLLILSLIGPRLKYYVQFDKPSFSKIGRTSKRSSEDRGG